MGLSQGKGGTPLKSSFISLSRNSLKVQLCQHDHRIRLDFFQNGYEAVKLINVFPWEVDRKSQHRDVAVILYKSWRLKSMKTYTLYKYLSEFIVRSISYVKENTQKHTLAAFALPAASFSIRRISCVFMGNEKQKRNVIAFFQNLHF